MNCKYILTVVAVLSAVAGVCGEYCDVRTRTYVDPVRIVSAGGISTDDAQHLCAKHFGQVPEGRFLNGSGPVLGGGAWVILDFGREIHGTLQIGSARGAYAIWGAQSYL